MSIFTRRSSVLAVAFLALTLSSCASKNKGKIEGTRWQGTEVPNLPAEVKMIMEFGTDGSLAIKAVGPGGEKTISGKYKLKFGDSVEFYDLSEPISGSTKHREKIIITGSELKMIDSDGTTAVFRKL